MFMRSHIKVKGHLRSSCMAGNLELVSLVSRHKKSDWNETWFMDFHL